MHCGANGWILIKIEAQLTALGRTGIGNTYFDPAPETLAFFEIWYIYSYSSY